MRLSIVEMGKFLQDFELSGNLNYPYLGLTGTHLQRQITGVSRCIQIFPIQN